MVRDHGRSQDFFRGADTFRKFSEKFIKKIAKNALFQHMKFWEHFRKFSTNFLRKLRKMYYFRIFSKNLTNHALIFRVWTKNANCWEILTQFWNFWWKFYRKIEFLFYFYFYFGKFVTKNRARGNNTIFTTFSVSGDFSPFPWLRPCPRHEDLS